MSLNRMFRPSCSECRGPIQWFSAVEAERDSTLRPLVAEAREWVGPISEVWRCRKCGEVGFFGGLMM